MSVKLWACMFRTPCPKHFVAAKGPFMGASLDRMEEAYDNLGRAADVCRFSIRYLESHENSGKVSKDDHLPSLNSHWYPFRNIFFINYSMLDKTIRLNGQFETRCTPKVFFSPEFRKRR